MQIRHVDTVELDDSNLTYPCADEMVKGRRSETAGPNDQDRCVGETLLSLEADLGQADLS